MQSVIKRVVSVSVSVFMVLALLPVAPAWAALVSGGFSRLGLGCTWLRVFLQKRAQYIRHSWSLVADLAVADARLYF